MFLSPNALCSIDDVKQYVSDVLSSEGNDRFIAMLINGISRSFEHMTGRSTKIDTYVEYFESFEHVYVRSVRVAAPPIHPGTVKVWFDLSRNFGAETLLTENKDYFVYEQSGEIFFAMQGFWDIGWANPHNPLGPFGSFGIPRAKETIKVEYVGGIVKPRQQPGPMPTYTISAGSLSGLYKYKFARRFADGTESYATYPALRLELTNKKVDFLLSDPGTGNNVVIYRTKADSDVFMELATLNGGGGPISYSDNNPDSALKFSVGPFSEGPLIVPDDIRVAVAQQIADWISRGASVTTVQVSGGFDSFTKRYDASQFTDFLKKTIIQYRINRN